MDTLTFLAFKDDLRGIEYLLIAYYFVFGFIQPLLIGFIASKKNESGINFFIGSFLTCLVIFISGGFIGVFFIGAAIDQIFIFPPTLASITWVLLGFGTMLSTFLPLIIVLKLPKNEKLKAKQKPDAKYLRSWVEESAIRLGSPPLPQKNGIRTKSKL